MATKWQYCGIPGGCNCSLPKVCAKDDCECDRPRVCVGKDCNCSRKKACDNLKCRCGHPKVVLVPHSDSSTRAPQRTAGSGKTFYHVVANYRGGYAYMLTSDSHEKPNSIPPDENWKGSFSSSESAQKSIDRINRIEGRG